ncbi:hypothetical protein AYO45_06415 [Gammaproteobacteria bacterium SCGC AG-212-F23]|nr:hypothetical protein AYO45_06415 [Gammaproteobacteria bacterium SCGC AG-212-F23]
MIADRQACFQLKASFFPCTILQISHYDLNQLEQQLFATIQRAPNFFLGSPVIIDLEKIKDLTTVDFSQLKKVLINSSLVPMGIRNGSEKQHIAAVSAGLPVVTIGKNSKETTQPTTEPEKQVAQPSTPGSKLVTTPIRSGMQIYAKDADLIVLAPVSVGAELLADGHIHVYGPLRGRALAGVRGNKDARIFCQKLDAELVSIAGYYLVKEELQNDADGGMMQIYLENEEVKLTKCGR